MQNAQSSRFFFWLLGIYAILFSFLAINPFSRPIWFAENLTVWIIIAVLVGLYLKEIRFSKLAYGLMFVLIYLHTIGGHYTFSLVPFDWVTNFFGFARNHFDRIAHFTVGFYAFAVAEWLWTRRLVANKFLLFTYPIFLIATIAMSYELVEWIFAINATPDAAGDYLGSQGDIWDAQKDMLANILGAIFATSLFFFIRRLWGKNKK